jgi:hypothetical protein
MASALVVVKLMQAEHAQWRWWGVGGGYAQKKGTLRDATLGALRLSEWKAAWYPK